MADYGNKDEIALWGADERPSDKHPTHKGSATNNGVEYWASGWTRSADANPKAPAMKISLTKKEAKGRSEAAPAAKAEAQGADFDSDIPFIQAERGWI